MLSASMAHSATRSTMDQMLESLKKHEEKPKDTPPALPYRPTSKGRLPSNVRMRGAPSQSVSRSSDSSANSEARVSAESTGLKLKEARVSVDRVERKSARVQGPWSRTEGESVQNSGFNRGFPRECEVGDEKISQKFSNGVEKLNNFAYAGIGFGSDSSMQESELSDLQYYSNMDSPYEKIDSNRESNGPDFRLASVAAQPERVEQEDANLCGLAKNSRVWCMTLDNQWSLGAIQAILGTEYVVKISNGDTVKLPVSNVLLANSDILGGVNDLIQLSYLNEASILYNLQHRYAQDMIYTKAGPVLVAVNPFKDLSLFGNEIIQAYRCKARAIPHVYMITDIAFDAMMRDGINQSIIVSGESGAGKTETAKIAMEYLASIGACSRIENKIKKMNPILESFGNAKTLRNDNSSRFGKLISVVFNSAGKMSGTNIQTYFLEKSRVVQQVQGERSFHIFYQLCAGASHAMREKNNLKPADEYHYLNQSNCLTVDEVDDAERFQHVLEALNAVEISQENQENVFRILAAVLWLGNITFSVDAECHVTVDNDEAIKNTSKLLGCSIAELMMVLSARKTYAGSECVVQKLSQSQAVYMRDTLAKTIYGNLFEWLIDCINKSLTAHEKHKGRSINIIDMYGFESFNRNSFEQLCINYANERLQQHFNRHLFKLVQEDYSLEGIDWPKVEFEDNQECLDLIEKNPLGLISLLDEESVSSEGSDVTLVNKLKQHLRGKSCFKGDQGSVFSVRHCAGEVLYDTTGFLEKNRDLVHSDLLQLLSSSNCGLLQLFAFNINKEAQRFRSPQWRVNGTECKTLSTASKFKGQLFKLLQLVENTSQHFICCIKPNNMQLPGVYDQGIVLQQLRSYGVFDVARMSRFGYPTRMTHEQFAKRYGFLLSQNFATADALSVCVAILHRFSIPHEMYRVGFTKLFLHAGQISRLDELRTRTLRGILSMQNAFRTHAMCSQFKKLKNSTIFLQALVRSRIVRKEYLVLKERHRAAVTIQKGLRCRIARKKYTRTLHMVILVQAVTRGWLSRRHTDMIRQQLQTKTLPGKTLADKSIGDLNAGGKNEIHPEHKQSEDAFQHASTFKFQPLFSADFQNRLLAADAALKEKEDENAVLRQRLQQYETRWIEYEAKMSSMEEMWQKQISSLQMGLAAATKKNLAADERMIQQRNYDESALRTSDLRPSVSRNNLPHGNAEFDWEDVNSMETKTPKSNPTSGKVSRLSDCGQNKEYDAGRSAVSHLTKEFEQRKHVFNDDANFLVEVKSGQTEASLNLDEELRKLKNRFEVWKKSFKARLRETKTALQKLGNTEPSEKTRRKWWGKRIN